MLVLREMSQGLSAVLFSLKFYRLKFVIKPVYLCHDVFNGSKLFWNIEFLVEVQLNTDGVVLENERFEDIFYNSSGF